AEAVAELARKDDRNKADDFFRWQAGARRALKGEVHGGGASHVDEGEVPVADLGERGFLAVEDGGAEALAEEGEFFAKAAAAGGDGESLADERLRGRRGGGSDGNLDGEGEGG